MPPTLLLFTVKPEFYVTAGLVKLADRHRFSEKTVYEPAFPIELCFENQGVLRKRCNRSFSVLPTLGPCLRERDLLQ